MIIPIAARKIKDEYWIHFSFQAKTKQAQQEHQINLMTVGLNQCLGALHILQDEVVGLRQLVERVEHANSHQQQQQQHRSNVTNR